MPPPPPRPAPTPPTAPLTVSPCGALNDLPSTARVSVTEPLVAAAGTAKVTAPSLHDCTGAVAPATLTLPPWAPKPLPLTVTLSPAAAVVRDIEVGLAAMSKGAVNLKLIRVGSPGAVLAVVLGALR